MLDDGLARAQAGRSGRRTTTYSLPRFGTMQTHKLRLTTAAIRPHLGTPCILWDTDEPGLGLTVRAKSATFILMKAFRGKSIKLTIGRYGAWTPDAARKRARELVVELNRGIDPREQERAARAQGTTLAEAVAWHIDAMRAKDCAQRSMDDVQQETERHLKDWLPRPLAAISTDDAVGRHKKITKSGIHVAKRVMRHLRAVWRTAERRLEDLPRCPVRAVTFHKQRRRREPITWDALPAWWQQVQEIENPVMRDYQFLMLFTGLRRHDARTIRWEDLRDDGSLHRPRPKGGEDRAFTVPVAEFVLELLERRRAENRELFPAGDGGWVFPARAKAGHVTHLYEARVMRYVDGKRLPATLPSPHRLRDTFATAAHEAGVHPFDLKILMNHSLASKDVTEGYVRPSDGHLRGCAERIAKFLLKKAGVRPARKRRAG
ncbi:MAG: tyrosine-type recombinase/integrase [Planctomycetota bacterium]